MYQFSMANNNTMSFITKYWKPSRNWQLLSIFILKMNQLSVAFACNLDEHLQRSISWNECAAISGPFQELNCADSIQLSNLIQLSLLLPKRDMRCKQPQIQFSFITRISETSNDSAFWENESKFRNVLPTQKLKKQKFVCYEQTILYSRHG